MKELAITEEGRSIIEVAPDELALLNTRPNIEARLEKLDRILDIAGNSHKPAAKVPPRQKPAPERRLSSRSKSPTNPGKTRTNSTKSGLKRPAVDQNSAAAIRQAVVTLLSDGNPRSPITIFQELKEAGTQFTAKNPLHALRQMLNKNVTNDFRRVGTGLYTAAVKHVTPGRSRNDLDAQERELVDADPGVLTAEAKARRLELLKQLGSNQ